MSSAGDTAGMVAARAKGAGNYLSDYAMEHPIRIAVTVGALTWWMLRGRDRSYDWDGAADTNWDDAEAMAYDEGRSLRDRAGEVVSTARETVGEYAATARDTVGAYASGARDKAGEYASTAREKAGEYASSARQVAGEYASSAATRARSAANTTGDWVTENPVAAGAIALAIGAAIGMSAPRTDLEDCTLGETRDRAWEKASQVAKNLKENVTEKVSAAAENLVGDTLKNAATTSPSEGRTL